MCHTILSVAKRVWKMGQLRENSPKVLILKTHQWANGLWCSSSAAISVKRVSDTLRPEQFSRDYHTSEYITHSAQKKYTSSLAQQIEWLTK